MRRSRGLCVGWKSLPSGCQGQHRQIMLVVSVCRLRPWNIEIIFMKLANEPPFSGVIHSLRLIRRVSTSCMTNASAKKMTMARVLRQTVIRYDSQDPLLSVASMSDAFHCSSKNSFPVFALLVVCAVSSLHGVSCFCVSVLCVFVFSHRPIF